MDVCSALVVVLGWLCVSRAWPSFRPSEELKTLAAPPEIEVSLFACEPLVTNPAAIDVDTHGRVWVAEIQFYRGGAKKPPADKIKVLEDTDGDGRADKVTVFAEGLFAPMSICVAGGKVYVATSPDLWVFTKTRRRPAGRRPAAKSCSPVSAATTTITVRTAWCSAPTTSGGCRTATPASTSPAPTARTSSTSGAPCCAASSTAASWKPWP